jgi:hypothetical protein
VPYRHPGHVPLVDVLDDTFVRLPAATVRARTGDSWTGWLPDLQLRVHEDRGVKGVRWVAASSSVPRLTGSAEVWLEPVPQGTVVHLYVRLDPDVRLARGTTLRRALRLPDRVRRTWKRGLHDVTDQLAAERVLVDEHKEWSR